MTWEPKTKWGYLILSVSIMPRDDERLDRLVTAAKATNQRASKSSVIRDALEHYERCAGEQTMKTADSLESVR